MPWSRLPSRLLSQLLPRRSRLWVSLVWCASLAAGCGGGGGAAAGAPPGQALPSKASVIAALRSADAYWRQQPADVADDGWASSVFHIGNLAAYGVTGDAAPLAFSTAHAEALHWLVNRGALTTDSNPQAVGQVYLGLTSDAAKLASLQAQTDVSYDADAYQAWTWVDAMFMQMPVFVALGLRDGNLPRDYHAQMFKMFSYTESTLGLYDATASHLWFRDASYRFPGRQTAGGKKLLWSRGNGWVFALLARTLDTLPASDPHYAAYQGIFQDMAASLVARQRSDGFWNPNLDDPNDFGGPETSGTAAFVEGLAIGIRRGLLADAAYAQALANAWHGLSTTALRADGFVGYCQPEGTEPAAAPATSTTDFCVGLFLMGASELSKIATGP